MLTLDFGKHAIRFLDRLPPKQTAQVMRKIKTLLADPYPPDSKKLKGAVLYRADIGEYRIIYRTQDDVLKVVLIGKRNDDDVYRRLKRLEG